MTTTTTTTNNNYINKTTTNKQQTTNEWYRLKVTAATSTALVMQHCVLGNDGWCAGSKNYHPPEMFKRNNLCCQCLQIQTKGFAMVGKCFVLKRIFGRLIILSVFLFFFLSSFLIVVVWWVLAFSALVVSIGIYALLVGVGIYALLVGVGVYALLVGIGIYALLVGVGDYALLVGVGVFGIVGGRRHFWHCWWASLFVGIVV